MKLTIDGQVVDAREGVTILQASLEAGIYIPAICHHPDLPPFSSCEPSEEIFRGDARISAERDGRYQGCGLCVVLVQGSDHSILSCETPAEERMVIDTKNESLKIERKKALARILRDHPRACLLCAQKEGCSREPCSTDVPKEERCCPLMGNCELERVADFVGMPQDLGKYQPLNLPVLDDEPLFRRDYNLCIGCTRCVRACRDLRGVDALGYVLRGDSVVVGTLKGNRLTDAGCAFCSACVEVCPTGALVDKKTFTLADREQVLLPCRSSCPAGIDVPAYIRAIRDGEYDEAARVICESVPFPLTLGMVCHRPCEDVCRRGEVDDPIAICDLKRFAAETGAYPDSPAPASVSGRRIAIVGSGPAGLTAAFYLKSKGHEVTIFEREDEPGGMLRYAIPAYRLPDTALRKEIDRALEGVELKTGAVLGRDFTLADLRSKGFDALLLSTGAGSSKKLEIPGVDSPLVYWGIDFLKMLKTGERPHLGDRVIVVGGGNVAVDVALCCLRMGPDEVSLVCLESESEMPAFKKEIETAREEGLTITNGWGPEEIQLSAGKPQTLTLKKCTRVFDEKGSFSPVFDEATLHSLPADTVIMAIGQSPDMSLLSSPGMPAHNALGCFVTEGTHTNLPDVFAAGDAVRGPSSVIEALSDGLRAAQEIDAQLGGDGLLANPRIHPAAEKIGKKLELIGAMRTKMRVADPGKRKDTFETIELGFDSLEATRESNRCLQCDLRLKMASVIPPPERWIPLESSVLDTVPDKEGVYQLADEQKKILKIAGTRSLKESLEAELASGENLLFCFDEDPMYTKRESELIQQYLQKYGELPGGGEGDLDDLF